MTDKELSYLLNLYMISRWQIVEVGRRQNVMEHSFRVWLLATHLYDRMFPTSHNSFEREAVGRRALLHDAAELFTGDIPTPVKQAMATVARDKKFCDKLDAHVLERFLPTLAKEDRGNAGTLCDVIVSLADRVEAILYLRRYAHDRGDYFHVEEELADSICEKLNQAEHEFTTADWRVAERWVSERLDYWDGFSGSGELWLIRQRRAQQTAPPAEPSEQSPGSD